ncbi:hypothetical protein EV194_11021 [Natronoflexus pectinivorans]|uniref:Uncharacterized protein n=1 Tax=Natronoflexus pectinivorans TaxID=682526 RepID=A0A4R2GFN0_9BACT|nr:hypothetical protein EV194_11021 [Natronoflexus pectinivorans]
MNLADQKQVYPLDFLYAKNVKHLTYQHVPIYLNILAGNQRF